MPTLSVQINATNERAAAQALLSLIRPDGQGLRVPEGQTAAFTVEEFAVQNAPLSDADVTAMYARPNIPEEGGCVALILEFDSSEHAAGGLKALAAELGSGECDLSDRRGDGWSARLCEYSERLTDDE